MIATLRAWLEVLRAAGRAEKHVIVFTEHDLPRDDDGVVTFEADTIYQICGKVSLARIKPSRRKRRLKKGQS